MLTTSNGHLSHTEPLSSWISYILLTKSTSGSCLLCSVYGTSCLSQKQQSLTLFPCSSLYILLITKSCQFYLSIQISYHISPEPICTQIHSLPIIFSILKYRGCNPERYVSRMLCLMASACVPWMQASGRIVESRRKGENEVCLLLLHFRRCLCNGFSFQPGDSSPGAPVVPPSLLVPPGPEGWKCLFAV